MNEFLKQLIPQPQPKFASDINSDVRVWLADQAQSLGLHQLLAHADDGVIWGRFEKETGISIGHDAASESSPPLRLDTLQQCRLFGERGELFLWRQEDGWAVRLLVEPQTILWEEDLKPITETQIVWGTEAVDCGKNFSVLTEKSQNGLQHVVPISADHLTKTDLEKRRLRLTVRHYLEEDSTSGEARVALSRLVRLGLV